MLNNISLAAGLVNLIEKQEKEREKEKDNLGATIGGLEVLRVLL